MSSKFLLTFQLFLQNPVHCVELMKWKCNIWEKCDDAKVTEGAMCVLYEWPHEKTNLFFAHAGKVADQLPAKHATDQRLCFHYTDSAILPLPESEI